MKAVVAIDETEVVDIGLRLSDRYPWICVAIYPALRIYRPTSGPTAQAAAASEAADANRASVALLVRELLMPAAAALVPALVTRVPAAVHVAHRRGGVPCRS